MQMSQPKLKLKLKLKLKDTNKDTSSITKDTSSITKGTTSITKDTTSITKDTISITKDTTSTSTSTSISDSIQPIKIVIPVSSTKYFPTILTNTEATNLFHCLKNNIKWENGIKSTRLAKSIALSDESECGILVRWAVVEALSRAGLSGYLIHGVYLNYYRNGDDHTPKHKHKDTTQLVISLNDTNGDRTLTIGNQKYRTNNGDAIIFGDDLHGIPRESNRQGRISIATFMQSDPKLEGKLAFY